jgi:hypothetical protein
VGAQLVALLLVLVDAGVGDKIMKLNKDTLGCPVCKKEVYSGVGKGCKMCGMSMEEVGDFCCNICMRKYNTINKKMKGGLK